MSESRKDATFCSIVLNRISYFVSEMCGGVLVVNVLF